MKINDPLEMTEDVPGAQSLTRGIDLLLLLGRSPPLNFRQIQDHLALSKGSLHRLLSALRSRRLIRYDRHTRRYAIGATVMSLARGALDRDATVRACQAEMSRLSQLLRAPCCLYVSDDDSVFVLDAADPAGRTVRVWPRLSLQDSPPGQAMLASQPAGSKNEWSTDMQRIISKARALGYVASFGDPLSVAAAVLDSDGTAVGALCCQFDSAGTDPDALHDAGQIIREAARRASHHIGMTQRLNEQVIAPRPEAPFEGKVLQTGRDYVGESPSWCAQTGRLWWLDVLAPALRWLDVDSGTSGRTLLDGLTGRSGPDHGRRPVADRRKWIVAVSPRNGGADRADRPGIPSPGKPVQHHRGRRRTAHVDRHHAARQSREKRHRSIVSTRIWPPRSSSRKSICPRTRCSAGMASAPI